MSFGVKQSSRDKSWTEILLDESDRSLRARGAKRKHTFRRMYMTVFLWFGVLLSIYCSFFYVGAFLDVGKVIGVSQAQRAHVAKRIIADKPASTKREFYSPLIDLFSVNRIYLRRGQSIIATYSLPENTSITLQVKQCKNMPGIEVFKCNFIGQQKRKVSNKVTGFVKFTAPSPGFYYFENTAIKYPDTELKRNHSYKVVWQRT